MVPASSSHVSLAASDLSEYISRFKGHVDYLQCNTWCLSVSSPLNICVLEHIYSNVPILQFFLNNAVPKYPHSLYSSEPQTKASYLDHPLTYDQVQYVFLFLTSHRRIFFRGRSRGFIYRVLPAVFFSSVFVSYSPIPWFLRLWSSFWYHMAPTFLI